MPGIYSRTRLSSTAGVTIFFMGGKMDNIVCERPLIWQPKEIVDLGDGCKIGITSDDGYYLVLLPSYKGSWKPSNWIPAKVAKRLGELATIQISVGSSFI